MTLSRQSALRRSIAALMAAAAVVAAAPALAQPATPAPAPVAAPTAPPRLLVVISVDQLGSDLFSEYRAMFTGGLARLAGGVVFPAGYQSHAATETCPGHSTILTGVHPGRNGIVANNYFNLDAPRTDKKVYCAEDESLPLEDGRYAPSVVHLKVPTLGDMMKRANAATRVVSIAGKDRAAIMMGGHQADETWWLAPGTGLASYRGRAPSPAVSAAGAAIGRAAAAERPAMDMPAACAARNVAVTAKEGQVVGTGRFARRAGDMRSFAASPEADGAVLAAGAGLRAAYRLGEGGQTDLLILGLSATDYVGHAYGTGGSEMCLQMLGLDQELGRFLDHLDGTGVDYAVALTADHGGHDLPERLRELAIPEARRVEAKLSPDRTTGVPRWLNDEVARAVGANGDILYADAAFGDYYLAKSLTPAQRTRAVDTARRLLRGHADVEALYSRADIMAVPVPTRSPELWSTIERVRAGYDPDRSGDFYVVLKPRVTPIPEAGVGFVATHGSAWDYDRRVPILFWRKGMAGFEQPNPVQVIDIAPTLASMVGLSVAPGTFDGRCLDLRSGTGDSCAR